VNDLGAGNIEKSLTYESNFRNLKTLTIEEKLIRNRTRLASRVKIYESDSLLLSKRIPSKSFDRSTYVKLNESNNKYFTKKEKFTNPELAGYDLDDVFKTSPPVGWKRPASRATIFAKMLVNEKRDDVSRNIASSKVIKQQKKVRMDKEIYLEAVYREDIAGQIFMKYLISKKKLVI